MQRIGGWEPPGSSVGSASAWLPTWLLYLAAPPLVCCPLGALLSPSLCPTHLAYDPVGLSCQPAGLPAPAATSPTFHLLPLALLLGPDTPQAQGAISPSCCPGCQQAPSAYGTSPCWHATSCKHPQIPTPICLASQGLRDLRSCLLPSQIPCCPQAGNPMACPAPVSPRPCSPHVTPGLQLVWELPPRPSAFPITAHSHEPPPSTENQTSG